MRDESHETIREEKEKCCTEQNDEPAEWEKRRKKEGNDNSNAETWTPRKASNAKESGEPWVCRRDSRKIAEKVWMMIERRTPKSPKR